MRPIYQNVSFQRKVREWLKTKQGIARVKEEVKKRKAVQSMRIGVIDASIGTLTVSASKSFTLSRKSTSKVSLADMRTSDEIFWYRPLSEEILGLSRDVQSLFIEALFYGRTEPNPLWLVVDVYQSQHMETHRMAGVGRCKWTKPPLP